MPIPVELEDGRTLEFPDGTSSSEIKAYVDSKYPVKKSKSTLENIGETVSNVGDTANKAKDWMIENIPVAKSIRPALEVGGATIGGMITAPGIVTSAAGVGGGFLAGKKAADVVEELVGMKQSKTIGSEVKEMVTKDIPTASIMGMTGPLLGGVEKVQGALVKPTTEIKGAIPWTADKLGKVIRPVWGRLTGAGTGAIDEALKSGKTTGQTQFDKALKGKISGEEVVENAKEALNVIKNNRSDSYVKQLDELPNQFLSKEPISQKLDILMKKFGYRWINPNKGLIESKYTKGALGKQSEDDIKNIVSTVNKWGDKEGDLTPRGLDTLKRYLDDFYSESSNARAFVSDLRKTVNDTISSQVPNYKEMTSGYAEATTLIKEIEQGLSLKKSGISGRITADQTLRRLLSSMRDNFELRKELVQTLGAQSGEDLSGQIAGYALKSPVPIGLAGTGPILSAEILLAKYVNPKFWPLLVASSPRVAAEFLKGFGKASVEMKMAKPIIKPIMGKLTADQLIQQEE
jgi:hypothetical protein